MVQHTLPVGLRYETYRWGEGGGGGMRGINKALGHAKYSLSGILKNCKKVKAHAGIEERLTRDLVIKEALQIEIKATLSYKNQ